MLDDPTRSERRGADREGHVDAVAALTQAADEQAQRWPQLPDPVWQGRAAMYATRRVQRWRIFAHPRSA